LLHYDYSIPIIYVIDYGLSKSFRSQEEHIPFRENKPLTGTARYASLNTHMGLEQSRRDDLESLGYVLIYFLNGELPWQSVQAKTKQEKYDLIMECKANTSIETLTNGREELSKYLHYCRSLAFTDKPDYKYLRGLFRQALTRETLDYDFMFDWMTRNEPVSSFLPKENHYNPQVRSYPRTEEPRESSHFQHRYRPYSYGRLRDRQTHGDYHHITEQHQRYLENFHHTKSSGWST